MSHAYYDPAPDGFFYVFLHCIPDMIEVKNAVDHRLDQAVLCELKEPGHPVLPAVIDIQKCPLFITEDSPQSPTEVFQWLDIDEVVINTPLGARACLQVLKFIIPAASKITLNFLSPRNSSL